MTGMDASYTVGSEPFPELRGTRCRLLPPTSTILAFSKPPIGKRGYNEDEVGAFLDLVENTELSRL